MKLLIGYGNTLRRDDGVGWWVADRLAPHFTGNDEAGREVEILRLHQLLPEVAAEIARADGVVFVDAALPGDLTGQPGTVRVHAVQPAASLSDAHTLHPPELLRLTMLLYGHLPPAHLVTITGADFDLGEGLSAVVETVLPRALAEVLRLLVEPLVTSH